MEDALRRLAAQVERLLEALEAERGRSAAVEARLADLQLRLEQALERGRGAEAESRRLRAELAGRPSAEALEEARRRLRALIETTG
jgi:hypothetical protein